MDRIKALITESIQLAGEQYKKVNKEREDDVRYHEKQRAQAQYFNMTQKGLSDLKIQRLITDGITSSNTSYCLKKFLNEEAEIIKETNLEWDNWEVPITYPVTSRLEVEPGVFVEIWKEVTVFFKWKTDLFCASISPSRHASKINSYQLVIAAKEWESLRSFSKVFHEFSRENHYLKGKKFIGVEGKLMPISHYDWDSVVLGNGMAQKIRSEVESVIRCAKDLNRYGLNSKKGFILAGDPGNGKTLILKIIANTVNATCIMMPFNRSTEDLNMPGLFSLARDLAPTILILEDIDLYGEEREVTHNTERLGELMNELDGMIDNQEIIIFATTNNLSKVERALQSRPGRFDRIYKIMNPDFEGRLNILTHFINKVPHKITPEDIETLAKEFAGYSGAYLKELINTGFAQAIMRDEKDPVLCFSDLADHSDVLKTNEEKKFLGFMAANNTVVDVKV